MSGDDAASAKAMPTRIINILGLSVFGDYLAISSGKCDIMNVIRRNRGSIYA